MRGVHNCGRCDGDILRAVSAFSLSGDPSAFQGLDCSCKDLWKSQLALGKQICQPGSLDMTISLYRRL